MRHVRRTLHGLPGSRLQCRQMLVYFLGGGSFDFEADHKDYGLPYRAMSDNAASIQGQRTLHFGIKNPSQASELIAKRKYHRAREINRDPGKASKGLFAPMLPTLFRTPASTTHLLCAS